MAYSGSGSGTAEDPYIITSWAQLAEANNYPSAYWRLDVDLGSSSLGYESYASSNANGGEGWIPLGSSASRFTGLFDGNHHSISDLFIDREQSYQGLFGYIDGAQIVNLGVENVNVSGSSGYVGALVGGAYSASVLLGCHSSGDVANVSVGSHSGGLVGYCYNSCSVTDCHSTASVTGIGNVGGLVGMLSTSSSVSSSHATGDITSSETNYNYAGGLVGKCEVSSTASDCYATGAVSCTGSFNYGGGLVGYLAASSEISNCYATGNVTGNGQINGGLVGYNYQARIYKSYSTGKPTGTLYVGGFCGREFSGGDYDTQDNFWDIQTSETTTSVGATGKTTGEMKDVDTFTNTETEGLTEAWDMVLLRSYIDETWFIDDGYDYPRLGWEAPTVAPTMQTGVLFQLSPSVTSIMNVVTPVSIQAIAATQPTPVLSAEVRLTKTLLLSLPEPTVITARNVSSIVGRLEAVVSANTPSVTAIRNVSISSALSHVLASQPGVNVYIWQWSPETNPDTAWTEESQATTQWKTQAKEPTTWTEDL